MTKLRPRIIWSAAFVGVIVLGLASRQHTHIFPAFLGKYPGDSLWALMVFCGIGLCFPSWSTKQIALWALAVSYADEFSQIYQAEWINTIRATTIGHLILGSAFAWFDMLAYTTGIAFGVVCKLVLCKQFK